MYIDNIQMKILISCMYIYTHKICTFTCIYIYTLCVKNICIINTYTHRLLNKKQKHQRPQNKNSSSPPFPLFHPFRQPPNPTKSPGSQNCLEQMRFNEGLSKVLGLEPRWHWSLGGEFFPVDNLTKKVPMGSS